MKLKTLTLGISIAYLMLNCNPKEILEPASFENAEISYAYGDTTMPIRIIKTSEFKKYDSPSISNSIVVQDTFIVFKGVKLHGKPSKDSDLTNLKNMKDSELKLKSLQYVAVGSSLTAGVRDGGYFNEGILTAYPELIARQMNLKDFKSPVFESTEYNGIGRKVKTNFNPTEGPVQKYAIATNNTAYESYDELKKQPKLKKSKAKYEDFNNLALPEMRFDYYDYGKSQRGQELYLERFSDKTDYLKHTKKYDFFTYEAGSADYSSLGSVDASALDLRPTGILQGQSYIRKFLNHVSSKNMKGVFLNMPNHNAFPGHYQIPCSLIKKNSNGIIDYTCTTGYYNPIDSRADSLASPIVNINLKTSGWVSPNKDGKYVGEQGGSTKSTGVAYYNPRIEQEINLYGYPIVKLDLLFEKILAGQYVTNDGVKVNPDWKTGNFFSEDGFFPTTFGQAIIANEILKVINRHYKTNIPLIPTKEYLIK
jgi:hypothetical protein